MMKMKNWKYCKEYCFWINLDKIIKIYISSLSIEHETYEVLAIDEKHDKINLFTGIGYNICQEWLKEFMDG